VTVRLRVILVAAFLATTSFAPQEELKILPVGATGQRQGNWCWAATTEMIARYVYPGIDSVAVRQCDQASASASATQHKSIACCASPLPDHCDAGGWPDFPRLGFKMPKRTTDKPLRWDDLTKEIQANRPIAFSWHWLGANGKDTGEGHMVALIGYARLDTIRLVYVNDPWPVPDGTRVVEMTYSRYVAVLKERSHWNDYYAIQR
jgi:hypothetical protein